MSQIVFCPETGKVLKVGPYIVQGSIGAGASGRVKLGVHLDTNEHVAIKIVSRTFAQECEIQIMMLLNHPNIVRLLAVYETMCTFYLVLEYASGGELFDYIAKGRIPELEASTLFYQIVLAVDHLQQHNICHRDLKPENILLDSKGNVKVADFGMARVQKSLLKTMCGSPLYASPEVTSGSLYDGKQTDVWSLGVILFALLTGTLPFDDSNNSRLIYKIRHAKYSIPKYVSPLASNLVQDMLTVDPECRISVPEIKRHLWFRPYK